LKGACSGAIHRLGQGAHIGVIPYQQLLVEQDDIGPTRQRLTSIAKSYGAIALHRAGDGVYLYDSDPNAH